MWRSSCQNFKWRSKVAAQQLEIVGQIKANWQAIYKASDAEESALRNKLGRVGLPFPLSSTLRQELSAEIREAQSLVVGLKAKQDQIKQQMEVTRITEMNDLEALRSQLQLLQRIHKSKVAEVDRLKLLKERGVIPNSEMEKAKQDVIASEIDLTNMRSKLVKVESQMGNQLSAELAASQSEIDVMTSRLSDLANKQKAIDSMAEVADQELLTFRKKMALKMIEQTASKAMELELENTYNEALIVLAEKAMAELKGSEKDDD